MKDGKAIALVKEIQQEKENLSTLERGKQAAISMQGPAFGRQINEGDILYSFVREDDFRQLKRFKHHLSKEEIEVLREIASIMRKNNPVWGV